MSDSRREIRSQSARSSCRVSGRSAMTCSVGSERSADHADAHELIAEVLNLGLDDPMQAGDVRQCKFLSMYASNVSRTGAGEAPASGI